MNKIYSIMSPVYCILLGIIIILTGCNNQETVKAIVSNQKEFIGTIYEDTTGLKYSFYENSVIKEVYKLNSGKKRGKIISFTPEGTVQRIIFVNEKGEEIGDESIYTNGSLTEHLFKLNENDLLFYLELKENSITHIDGHPWFISGVDTASISDTISYYIASPIIPGYKTHVKFGMVNDSSSWLSYVNDIRQMKYKNVINKPGNYEFKLVVEIRDRTGKTPIIDSTTVPLVVTP